MSKCRDCKRCSEQGILTLLLLVPRIMIYIPRRIIWLFIKKCPQCGHPLSWHLKRADGSFKD